MSKQLSRNVCTSFKVSSRHDSCCVCCPNELLAHSCARRLLDARPTPCSGYLLRSKGDEESCFVKTTVNCDTNGLSELSALTVGFCHLAAWC